ncbi:hypothetical protein BD414DRAFT_481028 [Trametes punicea]|nr:hypothetical protein BD414DRAFT_481028 [Trametes punicea]
MHGIHASSSLSYSTAIYNSRGAPRPSQSSILPSPITVMNFLAGAERTVQDTANIASTTGLNVAGLAPHMPGPTIDRGFVKLGAALHEIQQAQDVLPVKRRKQYLKEHRIVLAEGDQLRDLNKRLSPYDLRRLKLIFAAHGFEDHATNLQRNVMSSSQYYRALHLHSDTASIRTVDSGWVVDIPPPSPQLPPVDANVASSSSGPPSQSASETRHDEEEIELSAHSPAEPPQLTTPGDTPPGDQSAGTHSQGTPLSTSGPS